MSSPGLGGPQPEQDARDGSRPPPPIPDDVRDLFLILLTCGAGSMDALSLLGLGGVFTSAVSGNTVLLGVAIIQGSVSDVIRRGVVFAGFVPGVMIAALFFRSDPRNTRWSRSVTGALTVELVALLALTVGLLLIGQSSIDILQLSPLIILSAFAMGLQYTTARQLNVSGVLTTIITGPIMMLGYNLVTGHRIGDAGQRVVPTQASNPRSYFSEHQNVYLISVLLAYFVGVVVSVALESLMRAAAAMVSFALVLVVVVSAWGRTWFLGRKRGEFVQPT